MSFDVVSYDATLAPKGSFLRFARKNSNLTESRSHGPRWRCCALVSPNEAFKGPEVSCGEDCWRFADERGGGPGRVAGVLRI